MKGFWPYIYGSWAPLPNYSCYEALPELNRSAKAFAFAVSCVEEAEMLDARLKTSLRMSLV